MACSPVPKVGGAAAPSAPPVPTSMYVPSSYYASKLSTAVSSLLLRDYSGLLDSGGRQSPSSTPITLSVEEFLHTDSVDSTSHPILYKGPLDLR